MTEFQFFAFASIRFLLRFMNSGKGQQKPKTATKVTLRAIKNVQYCLKCPRKPETLERGGADY